MIVNPGLQTACRTALFNTKGGLLETLKQRTAGLIITRGMNALEQCV